MYNSKFLADQLLLFLQANSGTVTDNCASFIGYLEEQIEENRRCGKNSATAKLSTTLRTFKHFLQSRGALNEGDLLFRDVTNKLLLEFEKDMKLKYLSPNTTSFYMRILRSYYHKGMEDGRYFTFVDPFKGVYTGVKKTKKRAITHDLLSKMSTAHLPWRLHFARDIFLFSFYTRGMSFVDIAELRQSNIVDGEIRYCRKKTAQLIRVRLEPCTEVIIRKYSKHSGDDHLFPILMKKKKVLKYNTSLKNTNNHLLRISSILDIDPPITTYTARHTWATLAREGGVPISTISEAMGHTSEKTTRIYLSSIGQETIDEANRMVIHSLNQRM